MPLHAVLPVPAAPSPGPVVAAGPAYAPRVLILSGSQVIADGLRRALATSAPDAHCEVCSAATPVAARLAAGRVDHLLLQAEWDEGDALDLLRAWPGYGSRTLVLVGQVKPRVALSLRALGVAAVHDGARDGAGELARAVDALAGGRRHWSRSFDESILSEEGRLIRHRLPPRLQLALALLATGLCEKSLAEHLGVTLSSARSLSRDLHARLEAHDRRDIARLGARLGYTRFGADGLQPFGLSVLIDEYRAQSRRPAPLPALLLSLCGMKAECGLSLTPHTPPRKITRLITLI